MAEIRLSTLSMFMAFFILGTLIFSGVSFSQEPISDIPPIVGDAVRQGYSAHGEQWEQFKSTRVELEAEILQA